MATQVSFEEVSSYDGSLLFRFISNGKYFKVKSFNNGIMVIAPLLGCSFNSFAKKVAGCFEEGSNFNGLKAIEFEIDGAYISVTAKDATHKKIIQLWKEKMEENRIRYKKEYIKTPEYRAERAKALKVGYRCQNVEELVKHAMQTEEFQFKDEEARKVWNNFVELHGHNADVVHYTECWAKFMQYLMAKHEGVTVKEIASKTSQVADIDGVTKVVTGFKYCLTVDILSKVWKHGEELRKWHNKKYGCEG